MRRNRHAWIVVGAALLLAALAYLRDPPWLLQVTSGLTAWETDAGGTRYRWTRGRASLFVPADSETVTLYLRSPKDTPSDWPITATVTIDDRPAEIIRFEDESWRTIRLRLPRPRSRTVRRIDLKLDRVRSGHRGIQLATVQPGSAP